MLLTLLIVALQDLSYLEPSEMPPPLQRLSNDLEQLKETLAAFNADRGAPQPAAQRPAVITEAVDTNQTPAKAVLADSRVYSPPISPVASFLEELEAATGAATKNALF